MRPPPTGNAPRVPPGCERRLDGTYVHAQNPSFHYRGEDDGGTLTLLPLRSGADADAGLFPIPGDTRVILTRGPGGFSGTTRSTQLNGAQKPCDVALPTEVLGCDDGGLSLRTHGVLVGLDCEAPVGAPTAPWVEQRLLHDNR